MNPVKEKEISSRCKTISERLSESMHILDHDPSMALYRLQEHVNKTVDALVTRKHEMNALNASLQGACFDLDNAIETVEQMNSALPVFTNVHQKLRDCLYYIQQISAKQDSLVTKTTDSNTIPTK